MLARKYLSIGSFYCLITFLPVAVRANQHAETQAASAFEHKDYLTSSRLYVVLLKQQPDNPAYLYRAGISFLMIGQEEQARQYLTSYVAGSDKLWQARYFLGVLAARSKDHQAAVHHLQRAIQLGTPDFRAWQLLAESYAALDKRREAAQAYDDALKKSPHNVPLLLAAGFNLLAIPEFDRAEKTLARALAREPFNQDAQALLLLNRAEAGDIKGASERVRPLIGQGGSRTYLGDYALGRVLLLDSRFAEALQLFDRCLASNPQFLYGLMERARALHALGRTREARDDIEKALAFGPQDPALTRLKAKYSLNAEALNSSPTTLALPVLNAPLFADVAAETKFDFLLNNSPSPDKFQFETMAGGVAVIDYDRDGFPDLFFSNGAHSPDLVKSNPGFSNRLYHNEGNFQFADFTERAGLSGKGFSNGVAVGDFDNDGWPDLFVTGVRDNLLYRNNHNGTFSDVTIPAGLARNAAQELIWSVGAAWLDYDRDGFLDLWVINYSPWTPTSEPYCGERKAGYRTYCNPTFYQPVSGWLYHNNGNGTFTDVTQSSGIGRYLGRGMGIVVADYDRDGWQDVFITNDKLPHFLFHNRQNGTFEEVGAKTGVAYSESGFPVSGMGADFRDMDNDGWPDLLLTDLTNEGACFYRNQQGKYFLDISLSSSIANFTFTLTGWTVGFFDFNNDGWKDIFVSCGHVMDNIHLYSDREYKQRNLLLQNMGGNRFHPVSVNQAAFLPKSAFRAGAFADLDNDGKVDIVVTALGERVRLLKNITADAGDWLELELQGTLSNTSAIGAQITVELENGIKLYNSVSSAVGYGSSSDLRVHFGLGQGQSIRSVEIHWPSGCQSRLEQVMKNQILRVVEPLNRVQLQSSEICRVH